MLRLSEGQWKVRICGKIMNWWVNKVWRKSLSGSPDSFNHYLCQFHFTQLVLQKYSENLVTTNLRMHQNATASCSSFRYNVSQITTSDKLSGVKRFTVHQSTLISVSFQLANFVQATILDYFWSANENKYASKVSEILFFCCWWFY